MNRKRLIEKIVIADEYHSKKAATSAKAWGRKRWGRFNDEALGIAWKTWAQKAYKKAIARKKS